jgi:hypothetical protein
MYRSQPRYTFAAVSLALMILAQGFQELAYRLWIPKSRGLEDDLLICLLPIEHLRAMLVMGTIVLLVVPFAVLALRYARTAPLASLLGFVFGAAFIGFEFSHRSLDFFLVGGKWAREFASANLAERASIFARVERWNEISEAWYFPLLFSHLLSSCAFLAATWGDIGRGGAYYLAPLAFALNVLRLSGRLLSSFAGQKWLAGLNENLYFPAVLLVDTLLLVWFVFVGRNEAQEKP